MSRHRRVLYRLRALGAVLASWLLVASAWSADSSCTAGGSRASSVDTAIAHGLAWIESHPATVRDGGLTDMIDEVLSLVVMANLSRQAEDREDLIRAAGRRLVRLEASPEFSRWVGRGDKALIHHYHLVLAAHLMQIAGQPSSRQADIVEQARRALAGPSYELPSVRFTVATLLQHMGYEPGIDMQALRANSLIEAVAVCGRCIRLPAPAAGYVQRLAGMLLYGLVHEVVVAIDFARAPPPLWLLERRAAVVRVLRDGVRWARDSGDVDLLCELVVTAVLLGEPFDGELLRGVVDQLLASQHTDGSWGVSTTTARGNKTRHTVLTATGVLWAFQNRSQRRSVP